MVKEFKKRMLFLFLAVSLSFGSISSAYLNQGLIYANETDRNAFLQTVYMAQKTGNDSNSGENKENPVKTFSKALELVADGGTVFLEGTIDINRNTVLNINKNITIHKTDDKGNVFWMDSKGVLSSGENKLTIIVDKHLTSGIISMKADSKITDGNYEIISNSKDTSSAVFDKYSNIEGTSKEKLNITAKNVRFVPNNNYALKATNAILNQEVSTKYGTQEIKELVLNNAQYNFKSTSSEGNRIKINDSLDLNNSTITIDSKNIPANFGLILGDKGADKYKINNSVIDIKNYGGMLADSGSVVATNSTFRLDGIHNAKSTKPFENIYAGDIGAPTSTFASDKPLRINLKDKSENTYEYGFPVNTNDATKTLDLPSVKLTFKTEDGSVQKEITVIKGNSLENLTGKVKVNGTLINKNDLNDVVKTPDDKEFLGLFVDGGETKYNYTDALDKDTTIVAKFKDKENINGVRYFLNENSADKRYVFVENKDGVNHPLSKEEIQKTESWFNIRSKKFVGWTTDREGKNLVDDNFVSQNGVKELYAKWEDRKAFNVTYHRQTPWYPTSTENKDVLIVKTVLYEGEHLAGVLTDPSVINAEEKSNRTSFNEEKFYYPHFSDINAEVKDGFYTEPAYGTRGRWHWKGELNLTHYLGLGSFKDFMRTVGWATTPDLFENSGSSETDGTFYRGGHTLTLEDFEKTNGELVLYNQWVELDWLKNTAAKNIADEEKTRPNITLAGENNVPGDYETAKGAFVVDHSQTLNYKAHLDFSKIRKDLVTLWGRINEITKWSGVMNAYFDSRLGFDKDVDLLFESTWLKPDEKELEKNGITVKQVENNPNQWIFTVSKDKLTKDTVNRIGTDKDFDSSNLKYYSASIPVTIIPKYDSNGGVDFQKLSFEDFMKPMTLTVKDNYNRGINAYITKDSANSIALSDNPVVIVGGDIQMNIDGFRSGGTDILKYQLKSNAYDEHAKLYPSGVVKIKYEEVSYYNNAKKLKDLENPDTKKLVDEYDGRAKIVKENYPVDDKENYSETFDNKLTVPEYDGLILVGIVKENSDGSKPSEFYLKDGNLEEGKALLKGEYSHSNTPTFTLKYAKVSDIISIPVEKKWIGKKATEVKVKLFENEVETDKEIVLKEENNWKGKFENLPKYDENEKEINYTIKETLEGYISSVVSGVGGFVITNTELISISVNKIWKDYENNILTNVSSNVKVKLYKGETPVEEKVLNSENKFSTKFENLLKYDDKGMAIDYTVKEVGEENGSIMIDDDLYKVEVSGNMIDGFTITNRKEPQALPLEPPLRSLKVTKIWKDEDGKDLTDLSKKEIKVKLYQNGEETDKELLLNKENGFEGKFENLKVSKTFGAEKINYTVKEIGTENSIINIDGVKYSVDISGNMEKGFVITNTKEKVVTPTPPPTTPSNPKPPVPIKPTEPVVPVKPENPKVEKVKKLPKTSIGMSVNHLIVSTLTLCGVCICLKKKEF